MLRSVDPNHDDRISFEEFIQMMQHVENKIVKNGLDDGGMGSTKKDFGKSLMSQ